MIEKMNYVTITGPLSHVDWVIEHYLGRYKIHLEHATMQLKNLTGLSVLSQQNPYQESFSKATPFLKLLENMPSIYFPMTGKHAQEIIELTHEDYESKKIHFAHLEQEKDAIESYIKSLRPFVSLDIDVEQFINMKHFKSTFCCMPLANFLQFQSFVYDEVPIIFVESCRDKDSIWGCFFAPMEEDVEAILASYNFEPIPLVAMCDGNPAQLIKYYEQKLTKINVKIEEMVLAALPQKNTLLAACHTVKALYKAFDIKQYAAKTDKHYIFTGWMARSDALQLERETNADQHIIVVHYENKKNPPTRLINAPGIRWFEFFVKLYGMPRYNEIDPTPILAMAYVLLFGLMFGDVGHGISLAFLGWLLLKKHDLGGVMIAAGFSATIFGFAYGSIFGIEHLIPAIWHHPIQNIADTLMFAVILGIVIIFCTFILNMINATRQKDYNKLFFSPNGVAGLWFYATIIAAIAGVIHWSFAGVPLAAIVVGLETGKTSMGMTIFQKFLGVFEILLAYLTNTISFVRVGAFALSHAGMMHVVMMLSNMSNVDGDVGLRNIITFVVGNLIVMGIEGLLVGIQSLRLGFYEIFSRFHEGGGKPFEAV